jgi:hypothetical protein
MVSLVVAYDPSLIKHEQDVPVSDDGEEVAVAILLNDGNAFAFSEDSYAHPGFANPAWQLTRGDYRVVIRVSGSNFRECRQDFKLVYEDGDFSKFRLR